MHIIVQGFKQLNLKMFLVFIFILTPLKAQNNPGLNTDSLYIKFLSLRAPELLAENKLMADLKPEDHKCGLELVNTIKLNLNSFKEDQKQLLKQLLSRPVLPFSIISPSGKFRIHYNDTGQHAPNYITTYTAEQNAMEVGKIIDSAYNFEVNYLGYPPAPPDTGGGDNRYDIYIQDLVSGFYGYTEFEDEIVPGSSTFTTFQVIDNDFFNFYSSGIEGAKVTCAHEYHHAIQVGNYISRLGNPNQNGDTYFYELTSTSMEEFVYGDVNDYIAYLNSYFSNTDISLPFQNGYNIAIWNIYLKERFGYDILKRQWELMPTHRAITAINNSILNSGSSLPEELNKFAIWTYYTNYRYIPNEYFEDARLFPLISPSITIQLNPPSESVDINSATVANNFVLFFRNSPEDSLYAVISNGDAALNLQNPNAMSPLTYTLYTSAGGGNRELNNDYSADFNVSEMANWSVSEILNNIIIRQDSTILPPNLQTDFAFPNPFYYSKNYTEPYLYFTVDLPVGEEVDFSVYSAGMQLIKNSRENISFLPGSKAGVKWDVTDNKSGKLASGVYIYVIKIGSEIKTGKIAIFNE